MIFLGDVAHPFLETPDWFRTSPPWSHQAVSVNLEGAFSKNVDHLRYRKLFNHPSLLPRLVASDVRLASLANNHVMDLSDQLNATIEQLSRHGIQIVGAGVDASSAAAAATVHEEGQDHHVLSFGWRVIGCKPATRRQPGANSLEPRRVLKSVEHQRRLHPNDQIIVQLHWNYEMELYPQPAHRQLAFAIIDAGADAVIGHHPHRVGGAETYRGKDIFYSLGNWWLPQGVFFDGKSSYAEDSLLQLALEWHAQHPPVAHWFVYARADHTLTHIRTEPACTSEELLARTPFAGMPHQEYRRWFRANRHKNRLLPVFDDHKARFENLLKEQFVHLRHLAIVALEKTHVRRPRA
jgi:hypothetical protein